MVELCRTFQCIIYPSMREVSKWIIVSFENLCKSSSNSARLVLFIETYEIQLFNRFINIIDNITNCLM